MKPIYTHFIGALSLSIAIATGASGATTQTQTSQTGAASSLIEPVEDAADAWIDSPRTPGDWAYDVRGQTTVTRYSGTDSTPLLAVTCDRGAASIRLERTASSPNTQAMTIRTETATRILQAENSGNTLIVTLRASDPLLDAIALTRGRFAVEAEGLSPLYLPAWGEVARVIEDCR